MVKATIQVVVGKASKIENWTILLDFRIWNFGWTLQQEPIDWLLDRHFEPPFQLSKLQRSQVARQLKLDELSWSLWKGNSRGWADDRNSRGDGQDVIVPTILEGLSHLKALVTLVICI